MKDNKIRLYSHSGLCNRLRLLNSYRNMSIAEKRHIEFHWVNCVQCWAKYEDIFEPIENIDFVYKKHQKNRRKSRPENSIITMNHVIGRNEESCNKNYVLPVTLNSYQKHLLDIIPVKDLETQIKKIRNELNDDYNACHIRRTDIGTIQNKYGIEPPIDEMFLEFASSYKKKLFLATDNIKTQDFFKKTLGNKVVTFSEINGNGSRRWPKRTTDIQSAVVDMFCCIYSRNFMGTECSSFSQFIEDYQEGIQNARN